MHPPLSLTTPQGFWGFSTSLQFLPAKVFPSLSQRLFKLHAKLGAHTQEFSALFWAKSGIAQKTSQVEEEESLTG